MNKKNIIAIAIVAIVVVAGIVVACTKDKDNQTSKQTQTQPAPKSQTPYEVLCSDMNYYWNKFEHAFVHDSTAFLTICDYNNMSAFLSMTGITSSELNMTSSWINEELPLATASLGTSWLSGWTCRPCLFGGLSDLGQNVRNLHNTLEALNQIEANAGTPCFPLYIDSCSMLCFYTPATPPYIYLSLQDKMLCWLNCIMAREFLRARNILDALSMGGDD